MGRVRWAESLPQAPGGHYNLDTNSFWAVKRWAVLRQMIRVHQTVLYQLNPAFIPWQTVTTWSCVVCRRIRYFHRAYRPEKHLLTCAIDSTRDFRKSKGIWLHLGEEVGSGKRKVLWREIAVYWAGSLSVWTQKTQQRRSVFHSNSPHCPKVSP